MLWSSVKLCCAVIVVCHQDKNKQLWKLPYLGQLKYNKAENVVALLPDQNLVSELLATFFVILKPLFVPLPFQPFIPEPSSLGLLLSHVPKYQIFLIDIFYLHITISIIYFVFTSCSLQSFTVSLLTTAFSYTSSYSCKKHRHRL